MCFKSHIRKKKKQNRVSSGFARVPGQPTGSPGFGRAIATAGLLLNLDQSSHRVDRVDRVPGRPGFNNYAVYCLLFIEVFSSFSPHFLSPSLL